MKYFFDTEFHEYSKKTGVLMRSHTDTIDLISIAIVSEEGHVYTAVCNEFDLNAAWNNMWLKENVLPGVFNELNQKMDTYYKTHHWRITEKFSKKSLRRLLKWQGKSKTEIANDIVKFVGGEVNMLQGHVLSRKTETKPEFYAYYADYDWVNFCWLFGRMINLPEGFPMYCMDLKQMMQERNLSGEWKRQHCPDPVDNHVALADAQWNVSLWRTIMKHDMMTYGIEKVES